MGIGLSCTEVCSVGRGDSRDTAAVSGHLESCAACRREVSTHAQIAILARRALSTDAPPLVARAILARARSSNAAPSRWPAYAIAAGVGMALAVMALAISTPHPTATRADAATPFAGADRLGAAPRPGSVVLELKPPSRDRLSYVVHSHGGTRQGELDLSPSYVLDTIPEDAVVVETF